MIKKIIFDLDCTLFDTISDAPRAYGIFLKKYPFLVTPMELYDKFEDLNEVDDLSFDKYYEFIKNFLGDNFTREVFDDFVDIYCSEVTFLFEDTIKVLEYLSEKYEIIVFSNWFYELQKRKCDFLKITKYFSSIYTIDTFGEKPKKEAMQKACYPFEFHECVMIGDNLEIDIMGPHNLGMDTIYIGESSEYKSVTKLTDLMNIL